MYLHLIFLRDVVSTTE